MKLVIYITLSSLLYGTIESNECLSSLQDSKGVHLTDQLIEVVGSVFKNYSDHINETIKEIREYIKTGSLPANEPIHYYLYTSENPDKADDLSTSNESLKKSHYNKEHPLVVVTHGFRTILNLKEGFYADLRHALFKKAKYNVIYVDYTAVSKGEFGLTLRRSYLVAKNVANFLQFMKDNAGLQLAELHMISVSLGNIVVGSVGYHLKGIGRMTALEPAGVFFAKLPKDLYLDRSDALFVDIIHTADDPSGFPKGIGNLNPIGHLDFYVNGGIHQPGCKITLNSSASSEMQEVARLSCKHLRSIQVYIESICNENCHFIGTLCESYGKFDKGLCTPSNSKTAIMGISATKPVPDLPKNEMFFLNTNAKYPFCKSHQP